MIGHSELNGGPQVGQLRLRNRGLTVMPNNLGSAFALAGRKLSWLCAATFAYAIYRLGVWIHSLGPPGEAFSLYVAVGCLALIVALVMLVALALASDFRSHAREKEEIKARNAAERARRQSLNGNESAV